MDNSSGALARSLSFRIVRGGLALAWYLSLVGAVVAVIFAVAYTVTGELEPAPAGKGFRVGGLGLHLGTAFQVPIDVRYEYDTDPHSARAIPPAVLEGRQVLVDGFDSVRLRLQDAYGAAYGAISVVCALAVSLFVIWQLREFCASVATGHGFAAVNGVRLRRIGVVVIGTGLVYTVASWVTASRYIGRVQIPDARLSVDASVNLLPLLLGLLLLVLGQLFQEGGRIESERDALKADQELTV